MLKPSTPLLIMRFITPGKRSMPQSMSLPYVPAWKSYGLTVHLHTHKPSQVHPHTHTLIFSPVSPLPLTPLSPRSHVQLLLIETWNIPMKTTYKLHANNNGSLFHPIPPEFSFVLSRFFQDNCTPASERAHLHIPSLTCACACVVVVLH